MHNKTGSTHTHPTPHPPPPYYSTEVPKQGLSFPHYQREKISMIKRHEDRKTALIPIPAGLGVRAGQSTKVVNQQESLFCKASGSGGALGAGQTRLLQQLHKQTINSANRREVAFVQAGYGNT